MNKVLLVVSSAACLFGMDLFGMDARQIVEESQKRQQSQSQRYEGVLEVTQATSKKSSKRWTYERNGAFGESKSLLRFVAPAEVKGVALLIVNHPDRASDQWMWTPELARDRRIALQDRSTRFFGTDFSFEDLEERDVNQNDYTLLGEEAMEGKPCWKIESKPKQTKSSQYAKVVTWIRQDIYVTVKMEMYAKTELVRRLEYRKIEKMQNIWTPLELEMADLKKKSKTILKTEKLEYNTTLKSDRFTLDALRRGE